MVSLVHIWQSTLSARERVLLAFQHREADRAPLFGEARNVGFIEGITGKKMKGPKESLERITAEAYSSVGIDMIRTLMTPRWDIEKRKYFDVRWDGYLNWKIGGEQRFTLEESKEFVKGCADKFNNPRESAIEVISEVKRIQAMLGDDLEVNVLGSVHQYSYNSLF